MKRSEVIKKLINQEVAIFNDKGSLSEIRDLLREAFPNDPTDIWSRAEFIYAPLNKNYWIVDCDNSLPIVKLSDIEEDDEMSEYFKSVCPNENIISFVRKYYGLENIVRVDLDTEKKNGLLEAVSIGPKDIRNETDFVKEMISIGIWNFQINYGYDERPVFNENSNRFEYWLPVEKQRNYQDNVVFRFRF